MDMVLSRHTFGSHGKSYAKPFISYLLVGSMTMTLFFGQNLFFQTAGEAQFIETIIKGLNNFLSMSLQDDHSDLLLTLTHNKVDKVRLDIKQGDVLVFHHIQKTGKGSTGNHLGGGGGEWICETLRTLFSYFPFNPQEN